MSRWLKSVNTLLDSLDGQVETAVEREDEVVEQGRDAVDDILAKRGLMQEEPEEEKSSQEPAKEVVKTPEPMEGHGIDAPKEKEETAESTENSNTEQPEPHELPLREENTPAEEDTVGVISKAASQEAIESHDEATDEQMDEVALEPAQATAVADETPAEPTMDSKKVEPDPDSAGAKTESIKPSPTVIQAASAPVTQNVSHTPPDPPKSAPAPAVHSFEAEYKKALAETREAQKESRTLRRHVVSLNSELEAAEAEIQAQRTELERAAERMEKDRARQKEEKDRLVTRHTDELKTLKTQHEQNVSELKSRHEKQLEDARKRTREVEERRMQEGGDWTKELEGAVQREQESVRRIAMLEDEKSTLLSQVSSHQTQETALEARLDAISQTADNAMEREREAEDRLDAALSMHARQLAQRQARESELERTVADLGAALVVARNKEVNRLKNEQNGEVLGATGGNDMSALRSRLGDSEERIDTLSAQLDLERQRSQTLQQELQDMSKERTEEASAAHARQLQNDRKIADMSVTIARLQSNLREAKKDEGRDSIHSIGDDERNMELKTLSEQLLQQQERVAQGKSEISALKNRLQVALSRADKAEAELSSIQDSDDLYDRMESAPLSGSGINGRRTMRRRGVHSDSYGGSIRAAIRLHPGQGDNGEKIGKAIDAVDSFSVQTGKYLRHNPLARAGFLLYLLLIHLWAFAILFFHAHSYETVHGDFGAGHQVPHGPHALMQAHEPQSSNP